MEWLRWIITIAAIAATAYYADNNGYNRAMSESKDRIISDKDDQIKVRDEQIRLGNETKEQERADMVAIQESISALDKKYGSFGYQLRNALDANNLSGCPPLSADVKRVRTDGAEAARATVAAANEARAGNSKDRLSSP